MLAKGDTDKEFKGLLRMLTVGDLNVQHFLNVNSLTIERAGPVLASRHPLFSPVSPQVCWMEMCWSSIYDHFTGISSIPALRQGSLFQRFYAH